MEVPEPDRVGVSEFGGRTTRIEVYGELESTNTRLRELASAGAAEDTVVVARSQTAGRGRAGRVWHSPADAGLYASILLRPGIAAERGHLLTFAAAIAVAEGLGGLGVEGLAIKWPNDVLVRGRKICGILTETSLLDGRIDTAVVGIGINVRRAAIPEDLAGVATSLETEGVEVEPAQLLTRVLERLAVWRPGAEGRPADHEIVRRWMELAPMSRNAAIRVAGGNESFDGVTAGIGDDGRLLVRRDDGRIERVASADVSVREK